MSDIVQKERQLSAKQHTALAVLLEGGNKGEAATAASVTPKTVQRWTNEDVLFYDELQRRKSIAVNTSSTRLAGSLDLAVDVMRSIALDEEAPTTLRLRASNNLITHALRVMEMADIVTRLDELEAKVARNGK